MDSLTLKKPSDLKELVSTQKIKGYIVLDAYGEDMLPKYKKAKARERQIAQANHLRRIANARKRQNKRAAHMKAKSSRGGQTNGIRF